MQKFGNFFESLWKGSADALRTSGIITTTALTLDVACHYNDTFSVDIENIQISQDTFELEEEAETGTVSFNLEWLRRRCLNLLF